MEMLEWSVDHTREDPPEKVIERFKKQFLTMLKQHGQSYTWPDQVDWLSRLRYTKVWSHEARRKVFNADLRAKHTELTRTEQFKFYRTAVQKAPHEVRDAVSGDLYTMNSIYFLDYAAARVFKKWPHDVMSDPDVEKRCHDFWKKTRGRENWFLMSDIRKCGLTFPHWILEAMADVLELWSADPEWRFLKSFSEARYYDEKGRFLGRFHRGAGLGMANRFFSAAQSVLFELWKREGETALFFNDDQVICSRDDRLQEWEEFLQLHAIPTHPKKGFSSQRSFVFCEFYFGMHKKDRTVTRTFNAWRTAWTAEHLLDAQQAIGVSIIEGMKDATCSTEAFGPGGAAAWKWLVESWGSMVQGVDLLHVPFMWGGWKLSGMGAEEISDITDQATWEYIMSVQEAKKIRIPHSRIPFDLEEAGLAKANRSPIFDHAALKDRAAQLSQQGRRYPPGHRQYQKWVTKLISCVSAPRHYGWMEVHKFVEGLKSLNVEEWQEVDFIDAAPITPSRNPIADWCREEIHAGVYTTESWVKEPEGAPGPRRNIKISQQRYSDTLAMLAPFTYDPEKAFWDFVEDYGRLPLPSVRVDTLVPIPYSIGNVTILVNADIASAWDVIAWLQTVNEDADVDRLIELVKPDGVEPAPDPNDDEDLDEVSVIIGLINHISGVEGPDEEGEPQDPPPPAPPGPPEEALGDMEILPQPEEGFLDLLGDLDRDYPEEESAGEGIDPFPDGDEEDVFSDLETPSDGEG
jgi:hypothetical protein